MTKIKFVSKIALIAMIVPAIVPAFVAEAAALTSVSDALTRSKISTIADHTIQFITPTGVVAGGTITITFPGSFTMGTFAVNNVDMGVSSGGTCTSFSQNTLAASASGATWGVAQAGQVITLTSGTGTVSANRCIQVLIGSNATSGGAGVSQITNPSSAGTYAIAIGGTMADSGSTTVPILTDDQVQVSATVAQTISFSLSANSVTFGTLTTANARYADTTTGQAATTVAHTMSIATNAPTGYSITYNGATLTKGTDTIPAATITGSATGTPGTAQFAISASTSGSSTIATAYAQASNNWSFVPSTTTTLVSSTVPVATETISNRYIANMSTTTPAGAYTTAINYEAAANF